MECQTYYQNKEDPDKKCVHYIRNQDDINNPCGLCKLSDKFLCVMDLPKYLPKMSYSSKLTFMRCHYAYFLYKICGITPKEKSTPLKLGTVWDKFKELVYGGQPEYFLDNFDNICDDVGLMDAFDRSKIFAMCKAYVNLGINCVDNTFECSQKHFEYIEELTVVHGYIDASFKNYFVEDKCTKDPTRYFNIFSIQNQVGTYFMSNPNYEYCVIKAVKVPELRPGKETKKKKAESPDEYLERVYGHIFSNPNMYFPGYNKLRASYGKRFYRSEFDLKAIEQDYIHIGKLLKFCVDHGHFVQNNPAGCNSPWPCDYLPVCKTGGVVSDILFNVKQGG